MSTEKSPMEAGQFQQNTFKDVLAALRVMVIYTGHKLSIFTQLKELQDKDSGKKDGVTFSELAQACQINERYMEEFVRACAVHGILTYQLKEPEAMSLYYLNSGIAESLTDKKSAFYSAAMTSFVPSFARVLTEDKLFTAFRHGTGVEYVDYGTEVLEGISEGNRPMYIHELASEWFPKIPDVLEAIQKPGANIADVGCGQGYSAIEMARNFPNAIVDGYDLDAASIEMAKKNLEEEEESIRSRVFFQCIPAHLTTVENKKYDLITLFECFHDMSNPGEILTTLRTILKPGSGVVFIADDCNSENLCEAIPGIGEELNVCRGQLNYACSTLHCLPAVTTVSPSAALGAGIKASTIISIAKHAGFDCKPIHENDLLRFYRLDLK